MTIPKIKPILRLTRTEETCTCPHNDGVATGRRGKLTILGLTKIVYTIERADGYVHLRPG